MQVEQFKILRAARAIGPRGFTKRELMVRADVRRSALDSLFRRRGDHFFVRMGEKRRGDDGSNSAEVWRLNEAALAEVDVLLDTGRATRPGPRVDPEAARNAMQDDHPRWQARVSLFDAVDSGEGPMRAQHLDRCHNWIAREERRLAHWGKAVEVPQSVRDDFADLRRRAAAVTWQIDRLAARRPFDSFRAAIDWLIEAAALYDQSDQHAFAPLIFGEGDAPGEVLAEAALLSSEFDGCPSERFIIAAIAALPSIERGPARRLLCDMLDRLGPKVGYALVEGIDRARPSERRAALTMVIPILIGFQSFPELLTRSHFASAQTWYYDLYFSEDWSEYWAPFWYELATHRRQKTTAVRRRLQPTSQSTPPPADSLRNELNATLGSAYLKIYSKLERQIRSFYSPSNTTAPNWLTAA